MATVFPTRPHWDRLPHLCQRQAIGLATIASIPESLIMSGYFDPEPNEGEDFPVEVYVPEGAPEDE